MYHRYKIAFRFVVDSGFDSLSLCRMVSKRTLADNPNDMMLGSKGLLKKSEFIRIIIDALFSLGFNDVAALLEKNSGIPLHNSITKEFLELVNQGDWNKSIDALQGFELPDEKTVKFLLLEQNIYELCKMGNLTDAQGIFNDKILPLGVDRNLTNELALRALSGSNEATETVISRSEFVDKKLQKLFAPGFIIPKKRLEYLLEKALDLQRIYCRFHNVPDSDLSLYCDHHCHDHKIPSETVQTLEEHTDEVWYLEFSHNGKYLASASKDKSAIIWEIDSEGKFSRKQTLVGHEKPVVMVLWSPDDIQVITCGEEEVIRRWDAESGQCVHVYQRNGVGSVSCGWFHDGKGIIGAMADRRIYLWNLNGSEIEHEQEQREQKQSDVAMTNDGKWIVSMSRVREISFFNRETSTVDKVIEDDDTITSFTLSKDNKYMLNNLINQEINIWCIDVNEPYKYFEYSGHQRRRFIIRSCFGGYQENFVASGSEDAQVFIWHREELENPLGALKGHSRSVNCVSWNPIDIHMLASASDDATIRIWGLATSRMMT
ncbi:putative WD repeat-containing protein 26 [Cardamine amara subsp. amara]|uniref:WD repeat-containing protein 26 n=1 Tax=Cardamine amara subsp. amara TaxID=228776 RepID=A0ABD1ABE9_CARAN